MGMVGWEEGSCHTWMGSSSSSYSMAPPTIMKRGARAKSHLNMLVAYKGWGCKGRDEVGMGRSGREEVGMGMSAMAPP